MAPGFDTSGKSLLYSTTERHAFSCEYTLMLRGLAPKQEIAHLHDLLSKSRAAQVSPVGLATLAPAASAGVTEVAWTF